MLTAFSPAGAARALSLPGSEASVSQLEASERAVAVTTGTSIATGAAAERSRGSVVPAGFGPRSGPLRTFSDVPGAGVAVAGPYVLAFEDAPGDPERQRLTVRNVETPDGPVREIPVPAGGGAGILEANGDYAAFLVASNPNARIVVVDVRTEAEVYRVPALVSDWGPGPDGRVVLVEHVKGAARIVTATPQDPGRRELTRMRLATPRVAGTPNGAALVRAVPNGLGQIVLAGYDGSVRPLTAALNAVNEFDFDGTRLAFNAGHCVFVGPIPAGAPALAPRDACFNLPAQLDFGWMDRKAQVGGRAVRVGLRCQAPPRAHCPARLRLRGPGFTVRRRYTIAPGLRAVSIRIPAESRDAAWRTGMTLETREHGRSSAGTVIPAQARPAG
jgi:hypothetical protein